MHVKRPLPAAGRGLVLRVQNQRRSTSPAFTPRSEPPATNVAHSAAVNRSTGPPRSLPSRTNTAPAQPGQPRRTHRRRTPRTASTRPQRRRRHCNTNSASTPQPDPPSRRPVGGAGQRVPHPAARTQPLTLALTTRATPERPPRRRPALPVPTTLPARRERPDPTRHEIPSHPQHPGEDGEEDHVCRCHRVLPGRDPVAAAVLPVSKLLPAAATSANVLTWGNVTR
jgi:hypothetical protein